MSDQEQTTAEKVAERLSGQVGALTAQIHLRDVLLEEARAKIAELEAAAPPLPRDD